MRTDEPADTGAMDRVCTGAVAQGTAALSSVRPSSASMIARAPTSRADFLSRLGVPKVRTLSAFGFF